MKKLFQKLKRENYLFNADWSEKTNIFIYVSSLKYTEIRQSDFG